MRVQGSEGFKKVVHGLLGRSYSHLSASKPMLSHDMGSLQLYKAGQGAMLAQVALGD